MTMMKDNQLKKQAQQTLLNYLREIPFLKVEPVSSSLFRKHNLDSGQDILLKLRFSRDEKLLLVEIKDSGQPKIARQAVNQIRSYLAKFPDSYGVYFAPYISPQSAAICKAEGIGYADLAGNCYLSFSQVYIRRDDWPNPIKQKRGLRSLYAPKAARILRVMLVMIGTRRRWRVEALAEAAGVSLGQVSNVKKRLVDREWVQSDADGFWLGAPKDLLQEWSKNYTYRHHAVHDFYSLKNAADVEADLANYCEQTGIRYALTGFSAAARLAPSVRYQRAMAYVSDDLEGLTQKLGLKKVESGANLSILIPTDDGVFYGARTAIDGIQVVSPIQVYLDLKAYRGRGDEAAQAVLEQVIEPLWP